MKFLVSLKRSANPDGPRDRQSTRLSLVTFDIPPPDTRMSPVHGNIEMGLLEPPNARIQTRGPWVVHPNGRPLPSGQRLERPTSDGLSGVRGV